MSRRVVTSGPQGTVPQGRAAAVSTCADLLKGVDLEALEAEDVEQTDRVKAAGIAGAPHSLVHLCDQPVEEQRIDGLGKGVARRSGLDRGELDGVHGSSDSDAAAEQQRWR